MTWRGPRLEAELRDVAELVDSFARGHDIDLVDERPEEVATLRAQLVELGIWTVGAAAAHGGGGATAGVSLVALERLGRRWPALAWASVQAQVAADVLGADGRFADDVEALHAGTAAVAVVAADSAHVHLAWSDDTVIGRVDRVDVAAAEPSLLLLTSPRNAVYVRNPAAAAPLRRTGLGGAMTRPLDIAARLGSGVVELDGIDCAVARARLQLGAAAVAAGIAGAAVDQALAYTAERRQFGAALTALPAVRQSLFVQATRTAVTLAAVLTAPLDSAAGVLREACEASIDIASQALQSHGGYGYLTEYPAEGYVRDAVSLRAAVDAYGAAVAGAFILVGVAGPAVLNRAAEA